MTTDGGTQPSPRQRPRPRIGPKLAGQLRRHPPPDTAAGTEALARSLAFRIDGLGPEESPTGAASLARVLLECLDRLRPPDQPGPSALERVLERLSAPIRDGEDG